MPTESKTQTLTPTEIDAINLLCDLAHKPTSKQLQLDGDSRDVAKSPPLRLQNLALPVRARACRVVLAFVDGANYRDALGRQGLTHLEFTAIRQKDHNFALMFEAAKRVKAELTAANAQTGLDRLVTEDKCDLNAKAVMFALERLSADRFGRGADGQDGVRSGPKVVYNIVINADSGGRHCGNLATTATETPIIEVKPNE